MKSYFDLRDYLAAAYPTPAEWRRVAGDAGADVGNIVFEGSSLTVWSNILKALREQNRLVGLIDVLSREDRDSAPLAQAFAAEAANEWDDFVDIPAIRSITLTDADLQATVVSQSLDFAQTLPIAVLDMALADTPPAIDAFDAALAGKHTAAAEMRLAQFQSQVVSELGVLETHRQAASAALSELKAKIDRIVKAERPREPTRPDTSQLVEPQRQFLEQQHRERVEAYQRAAAAYNTERSSLDGLRLQARTAEEEVARLSTQIADKKVRAEVDARAFEEDIAQGRDKDLLLALDQVLDQASDALHSEQRPFKAFWTLLCASSIFELFERFISEAATGTEAGRRFSAQAEALVPLINDRVAEIARLSLAGPLVIQRALAANRQMLAALRERFEGLPAQALDEGRRRARQLIERPLPPIPQFSELETTDELGTVGRRFAEIHSTVKGNIAAMRSEIDGAPPDLRSAIDAAQADAAATIDKISVVRVENAEVLQRTRKLWSLMSLAARSAQVPTSLARLCSAVAQEFDRRAGVDVDVLLVDAVTSSLGLDEARDFVAGHLLTGYLASAQQLGQRLVETEMYLFRIEEAIKGLVGRPWHVEQKYRKHLAWIAILSGIPAIGLVAAVVGWRVVGRLRPLVISDEPAYIRLGRFATMTLGWAAGLSGLGASVLAAMIFVHSNAVDASAAPLVLASTAAHGVTFVLSVRNLLAILAHVRARSQPPGSATT